MNTLHSLGRAIAASVACATLLLWAPAGFAQPDKHLDRDNKMSAAGKRAAAVIAKLSRQSGGSATCLDVGGGPVCGVSVDNLVLRSVRATAAPVPAARN
jgi:hypothetical protein